jgi:thioesterase domain-containing protein
VFPKKVKRHIPMLLNDLKSFFLNPVNSIKNKSKALITKITSKSFVESKEFYQQIEKISAKHWVALKNYEVEPFDGKVYLFKAKINVHNVDDKEFLGWKKYAEKGVEKYMVPGDHLSMLLNPNAEELALVLQHTLDANG